MTPSTSNATIYVGGYFTSVEGSLRNDLVGIADSETIPTGIKIERHTVPASFALFQNYPNPFNPTTNIEFQIADAGFVTLKVYDVLGRRVATLVDEVEQPGSHEVQFDGSHLASGVYFYRIEEIGINGDRLISVRKMVELK